MQKSVQVRTPLYAAAYWQQAADEFKNIRVLAFAGMVTALAIILESFPIYLLGQSLKIYFSFVVVSLGCACYGPLVGMGVGAVIDTLGFLLSSYGEPYFPGYLITAMLSGLIYGVMLYQRKPTIPRLIVTRLLINYGSNVLLGSVWKAMLYGKGYLYYLSTGMVKNTIMIPIEVALMWLALNAAEKHGLDRRYLHQRWVRLISLGMTTRPSSSILRTIPVAFIGVPSCPSIFCTIYLLYGKCGGLCMVRACFLSVLYPALPAGHHAERLGNVGVHACFKRLFAVPLKAISILEIL